MADAQHAHRLVVDLDDDNPLVALRAVAGLHVEADRIEAVLVRRARTAGVTWAGIAAALGVSRQAVHKKYGR